jgi:hypothetical protein
LSSWKKLTNICCPLSMSPIGINGREDCPLVRKPSRRHLGTNNKKLLGGF